MLFRSELMAESRARDGTAMLFITHDLRLAAKIADEICVLYAGAVVEHGPATRVFSQSKHPYTRCLCLASPAMTGPRQALFALPDQMPGLAAMGALPGCRFAPRCAVAAPECRAVDPKLAGIGHRAACPRTALTAGIAAPEEPAPARPRAGPAVLTIDGLGKRFRTGGLFRCRTVAAVSGVSFRVDAGEFVAVVGESGSGKTTLGRLIMGLERPDSGRMVLDGKDVSGRGAPVWRHRIGAAHMVFQDPRSALNPRRQVAEIVTQALEAAGVGAAERATRAAALLEEMGLAPELAARTPSRLSGGQRQRANIARALCVVPKLLVADEIVSGLDVSTQAQLLTLLQRLRRDHAFAMLFISHDLAVVRHLCDRVLVMYRGAIVEQGPVEAVFAAPAHAYTRQLLAAAV